MFIPAGKSGSLLLIIAVLLALVIFYIFGPIYENVNTASIGICSFDSECIVVPYYHCCGSTKLAINIKYEALYYSHPEWQKFYDPDICAVIGMCAPDYNINEATCVNNRCQLKRF